MITKVKHIKNTGKFYNYSAKGAGLDWHKNTFIFAPNAYGKSTLVNVCKSIRDNNSKLICARKTLGSASLPNVVIIIDGDDHVFDGTKWNKTYATIQIFDVPFIHANILSHEIEHEHRINMHRIIIGAAGIQLVKELAALKGNEKSKRQQLDTLIKQFSEGEFSHHSLDAFFTIPATEERAVTNRIQKFEQNIKAKDTETQVRTLTFPKTIIAPTFDLTAAETLATKKPTAIHEATRKLVLDHIDKNISDKKYAKQFIRQGIDLLQAECPFCGQDLKTAANLLEAYHTFFDDTFRVFQAELEQMVATLNKWNIENELTGLVSTHNANIAIIKQWEPYIGTEVLLPDASTFVEMIRTKLNDSKTRILAELEKKQKDPHSDVDSSQFDKMSDQLQLLRSSVESYNEAVMSFTTKAKDYVEKLPTSDVDTLRAALAKEREIEQRFKPEWKKWATDYPAAKKETNDLLIQKEDKQKELETYTETIFGTYQQRINGLLATLGADFTITDLKGKTDERANESYSDFGFLILNKKVPLKVHQDDIPCFKNTLSEGDKSTLAFAFFVASLEKTPDLDKQIVIFDDPLSSLDETRREATARILLELSTKLKQLCVFTHKKDFLWMVVDKIPCNKVLQVRSDKINGSSLHQFDVEEDRKGEYAKMVETMQRYLLEDFGPTPEMIQGNIRKVFEVVLKTKYYHILSADIKGKKGFAKLLETLFKARLLNDTIKPKIFDLCSMTSGPHHGEIVDVPSKRLTRDELIPLIQDALVLLEKI